MSGARLQVLLWGAQRISAMVLALCVIVHLVTMIFAVRSGLTAAEILGRTQGSTAWLLFYAVFVLAVAVHAPIGLRGIIAETSHWRGPPLDVCTGLAGAALAVWGLRAVLAVFGGGAA